MRWPARFPWRWGAHDATLDQEHQALLDALSPGWDVEAGTELWCETKTDALALTMVWAVNRRVGNQMSPLKALEWLPEWESATKLRPAIDETSIERRRRLAGKLRGLVRNAIADLEAMASDQLGSNFVDLLTVASADQTTYWPGVNPGPPGFEFASNRAPVTIQMNQDQLSAIELRRKIAALAEVLDHARPAWLTYQIGVGADGFMVGKDLLGLDLL